MPHFGRGSSAAAAGRSGVHGGGALASTAAAAPSFLPTSWVELQDWDDYDFPEDAGGVGGGGSGADPFTTMLKGIPGFIAEDIAPLLSDLPLPAAGDIPGITVD
jgi:hypothetical protein